MSDSHLPAHSSGEVSVQLLDATLFRLIKSWTFTDRERITIGRSPDQDIELSDPYISRSHVELVFRNGQWRLISLGRHGVLVANQPITELLVEEQVRFRLGPQGPTLRFNPAAEREATASTVMIDTLPTPVFQLDEQRLQSDVGEIATCDYFQDLQLRAKQLRHRRNVE